MKGTTACDTASVSTRARTSTAVTTSHRGGSQPGRAVRAVPVAAAVGAVMVRTPSREGGAVPPRYAGAVDEPGRLRALPSDFPADSPHVSSIALRVEPRRLDRWSYGAAGTRGGLSVRAGRRGSHEPA